MEFPLESAAWRAVERLRVESSRNCSREARNEAGTFPPLEESAFDRTFSSVSTFLYTHSFVLARNFYFREREDRRVAEQPLARSNRREDRRTSIDDRPVPRFGMRTHVHRTTSRPFYFPLVIAQTSFFCFATVYITSWLLCAPTPHKKRNAKESERDEYEIDKGKELKTTENNWKNRKKETNLTEKSKNRVAD